MYDGSVESRIVGEGDAPRGAAGGRSAVERDGRGGTPPHGHPGPPDPGAAVHAVLRCWGRSIRYSVYVY